RLERRFLSSRNDWNLSEARGLGKTAHQVHVLDCLAGCPLHEVVDHREHDEGVGAPRTFRRTMHGNAAAIGCAGRARIGMAAGGHYVDEGRVGIALLEKRLEIRLAGYARIERCMDAAYQGRQVSAENEADLPSRPLGEALPDLRPVPMPGEAVGHEVVR